MKKQIQRGLVHGLLMVMAGCQSTAAPSEKLQQTAPRPLHKNLKLPQNSKTGFTIAGLKQGAVPQGLTLLSTDLILTSHYFDNGQASKLASTEWKTGRMNADFQIINPDGTPHVGHVGGLAIDTNHLWIASDAYLYRGLLPPFTNSTSTTYQTRQRFKTEAQHEVAFCSVFEGLVWAGEFALNDSFPTPPTHHLTARDGSERKAWVCGYAPNGNFKCPEKILSIPDRTQGIIATDEYIFLSRSYGRRSPSSLDIFRNPLTEDPHTHVQLSDEIQTPLWFLDGKNHVQQIDLPPMAENIAIRGDELLVLFESGANKFRRFGKAPIDQLILLDLKELIP